MARSTGMDADSVFINCPFDDDYLKLMEAMVFTVLACGFRPRSALEAGDSGEVRLGKILRLIEESAYSIHDISAVELDKTNRLPRFNMPFELGLAIGLREYGDERGKARSMLVIEKGKFTYQKCLSDIAGQDTKEHQGSVEKLIPAVRNWLSTESRRPKLPGPALIAKEFHRFDTKLPRMCAKGGFDRNGLPFVELLGFAQTWLQLKNEAAAKKKAGRGTASKKASSKKLVGKKTARKNASSR